MIKPGENGRVGDYVLVVTAGESLSARDAVYIKASDGKAYKCDADDVTKIGFAGFAQEAVTINTTAYIKHFGPMGGFSGLTVGVPYYLSGTAGEITATKPTNYKRIGRAITASVIEIDHTPTKRVRVYENSGSPHTWTKPGGLLWAEVEVVGGGSGGGSETDSDSTDKAGDGGDAAGYAKKVFEAGDLSDTVTVTVAAAGGNTTFGAYMAGNADGTATGGDINIPGEQGNKSAMDTGGNGGSTPLGTGGRGTGASDTSGGSGTGFGSGGGGGGNSSTPSGGGGAGAPGACIVTEYY